MLKFQLVGEIKKHWNTFPFVMHGKRTLFSIFKEEFFRWNGTYGDSEQEAFVQRVWIIVRWYLCQVIYRESKGIVLNFFSSFKNA